MELLCKIQLWRIWICLVLLFLTPSLTYGSSRTISKQLTLNTWTASLIKLNKKHPARLGGMSDKNSIRKWAVDGGMLAVVVFLYEFVLPLCVCVWWFFPGTQFSSHSPKTWKLLTDLSCNWDCNCLFVCLRCSAHHLLAECISLLVKFVIGQWWHSHNVPRSRDGVRDNLQTHVTYSSVLTENGPHRYCSEGWVGGWRSWCQTLCTLSTWTPAEQSLHRYNFFPPLSSGTSY